MEFKGKNVVVIGTGISGVGASKLLLESGACVYLYEGNASAKKEDILQKIDYDDRINVCIANYPENVDLVVASPGVPMDSKDVLHYVDKGIKVIGEIELAYLFEKGKVMAITGTNGKTTTTTLVGEIMSAYNEKTFVVGNIGNPYTNEVIKTSEDSVTVAEISSFQLETAYTFAPKVSAILNITPDHLNRHKTMEAYVAFKESICKNQTKDDTVVLNLDDEYLKDFNPTNVNVVYFSRKKRPNVGAYMDGDVIMYTDGTKDYEIVKVTDMQIIGAHNYENVMAAVCMCVAMKVPFEVIRKAIKAFKGVEHRIEFVRNLNDVIYYNDSKGTNPDASIKAIEAMVRPTILIAGGYDKGVGFDEFTAKFKGKVKLLVLFGDTTKLIIESAKKNGFDNIIVCDNLENAVKVCFENAKPGDAVLLSPACASWDMFTGYEQRGRLFKDYVNSVGEIPHL